MASEASLSSIAKSEKLLAQDFVWKQFIDTFTDSSDRVRYLMIVIVISSFVFLILWSNARSEGWMDERIETAQKAIFWSVGTPRGVGTPAELNSGKRTFKILDAWAKDHRLATRSEIDKYRKDLERLDFENSYRTKIPLLDLAFDINDLGAVVSITLSFLTLVLLVSVMRQHENLYLCLDSVKRIGNDKARLKPRADANLLYHSLAMAQVFSNPPTLGRWRFSWLDPLVYLIFILPLVPESLILANDWKTHGTGLILDSSATKMTTAVEFLAVALTSVAIVLCIIHERACRKRWGEAFFAINPDYRTRKQLPWLDWVYLRPNSGSPQPSVAGSSLGQLSVEGVEDLPVLSLKPSLPNEGEGEGHTGR